MKEIKLSPEIITKNEPSNEQENEFLIIFLLFIIKYFSLICKGKRLISTKI